MVNRGVIFMFYKHIENLYVADWDIISDTLLLYTKQFDYCITLLWYFFKY